MNKVKPYLWWLLAIIACLLLPLLTRAEPIPLQLQIRTPVFAPSPTQNQATLDWLTNRKVVKVAVWGDVAYPPFDLQYQADQFEGIAADYLAVLQQNLNVQMVIHRYTDRTTAEQALLEGEVDVLATYMSYSHQQPEILASHPYVINRAVILRRPEKILDTSRNLAGTRLAVYADDSIVADVHSQFPDASLIRYNSAQNAFAAVAYGQVDALWSDAASAEHLIKRAYFNRIIVDETFRSRPFDLSFAVRADNHPLLDGINQVLDTIPSAARIHIANRWRLGEEYTLKSSPLALTREESAWIAQHDKVRMVVSGSYAPLTFFDQKGDFQGLAADLLQRIEDRTGLHFTIVKSETQRAAVDSLQNGEADVIGALHIDDTDSQNVLFTRPYLVSPFVVVTQAKTPTLMEVGQLQGKSVSITAGNPLTPWIEKNYPSIHLVKTQDPVLGIEQLNEGKVDASITPQISADYFIQNYFPTSLRINSNIGPKGAHIAMATRQDNTVLLSILNKALLSIPPEELAHIVDRWRSHFTPATASSWSNYQDVVYKVLGTATIFILLFIIWNSYLRKQINQRVKAERALSDQLEFSRTLIDGSPIALYVRDQHGRLLQCNQAYLDFLHTDLKQVLGKTLPESSVMTQVFNKEYHALYQRILLDGHPAIADLEVTVDGQLFRIYHWTLPYQNGEGQTTGIIGGWLDITERQQLLHRLAQAKDAADSANHSKSVFLASMSHEIRTPMNAIVGLLELLQRSGANSDNIEERLTLAHESAQSLLSLIGDILDLSKIESGAMEPSPQPTHLPGLLTTVFKLFEASAKRKGLSANLIMEIDHPWVMIDALMLKQIASNLLSNAIKFTEHGIVEVTIFEEWDPSISTERRYSLNVTDTGIGISEDAKKSVYEPFIQVCGERMAQKGSGLGLSICRRLAELLKGTLHIDSEPGRGSTFNFEFNAPYCDKPDHSIQHPGQRQNTRRLNILIADDHAANRLLLCQQLEFLGHRVDTAEDGREALDILAQTGTNYDLLITDCDMPKMDGFSLVRNLRALEEQQSLEPISIFGLTANAQKEIFDQCLSAGMTDCIFKPLSIDALASRISRYFPDNNTQLIEVRHAISLATHDAPTNLKAFLTEVINSNNLDAQQLESAARQGDMQRLASLIHRIKGASKYVDGHDVVEACEKLEEHIKQGHQEPSRTQIQLLLSRITQLESTLQSQLSEI